MIWGYKEWGGFMGWVWCGCGGIFLEKWGVGVECRIVRVWIRKWIKFGI